LSTEVQSIKGLSRREFLIRVALAGSATAICTGLGALAYNTLVSRRTGVAIFPDGLERISHPYFTASNPLAHKVLAAFNLTKTHETELRTRGGFEPTQQYALTNTYKPDLVNWQTESELGLDLRPGVYDYGTSEFLVKGIDLQVLDSIPSPYSGTPFPLVVQYPEKIPSPDAANPQRIARQILQDVDCVALGDSMAFGLGVHPRENMVSTLNALLAARGLNLSVPGTGTISEIERFMVFLGLCRDRQVPVQGKTLLVFNYLANDGDDNQVLYSMTDQFLKNGQPMWGAALRREGLPLAYDGPQPASAGGHYQRLGRVFEQARAAGHPRLGILNAPPDFKRTVEINYGGVTYLLQSDYLRQLPGIVPGIQLLFEFTEKGYSYVKGTLDDLQLLKRAQMPDLQTLVLSESNPEVRAKLSDGRVISFSPPVVRYGDTDPVQLTLRALKQLYDTAQENGMQVLVPVLTSFWELYWDKPDAVGRTLESKIREMYGHEAIPEHWHPRRNGTELLIQGLDQLHIPYVDLFPIMDDIVQHFPQFQIFYRTDTHPTRVGQILIGSIIAVEAVEKYPALGFGRQGRAVVEALQQARSRIAARG
jgi:hypothetical protein